jgi:cytochrome c oxidase cbb3-type subunit I/II
MYTISMWISGVSEGLMWREFDAEGRLVYRAWTDMLPSLAPMYWVRAIGGTMYLSGTIIGVYCLVKTIRSGHAAADTEAQAAPLAAHPEQVPTGKGAWHRLIEGRPLRFTVYSTIAVAIGGAFEIIPSLAIESNVPTIAAVKPYTPLELEGRDIYVREGCYTCHSQMVRPFRSETERYGDFSKAGEFVYDRPFQFGSRRIGPDLHRVGGKYPNMWHYNHMLDPKSTSEGSLMPKYEHLFEDELDLSLTSAKLKTFKKFNAPYTNEEVARAPELAQAQAASIADDLLKNGAPKDVRDKEIVAMIAYLQRLGTDATSKSEGGAKKP